MAKSRSAIKCDCEFCGYKNTEYCVICVDFDMYATQQEKEERERMCDMMCGSIEED